MTSDRTLPGRLAWICGTCQAPIITGVVHISFSDLRIAESSHKDYELNRNTDGEDFHTFTSLFSGPRTACWAATCDGCRDDAGHDCANCYAIDIERVQSVFALWKWTRQIHRKSWFSVTNWIEFACNVADRTAPAWEATGVH